MYSENLKFLRKELNISAQKLADKLGVSLGAIQQYERGTREPNYNFLFQLNTKLNVNINWLMTGKGNMFVLPEFEKVEDEFKNKVRQVFMEMKQEGLFKD